MNQTGIELIAQERKEQIEKHGRTIDTDIRDNQGFELSCVASVLAMHDWGCNDEDEMIDHILAHCPDWNEEILRKMIGKEYQERLIIAGALIAAEIDRLNKQN